MTRRGISVVIPLYNKADYLGGLLGAFLAQLHPGDELLVVDDVSTDQGPTIARHMLEAVPGARLICMPQNAGPASARNVGARLAAGEHLLFFDADDIPSPHLLAELRTAIQSFPSEALFSYGIAVQARGEALVDHEAGDALQVEKRERHAFVQHSLAGRTLCTASSTCVLRSAFLAAGGFKEGLRYCEDPELWARLSAQHELVNIGRTLAVYRDVPESLSYGWRMKIGAANPYIETLLRLADLHGGPYLGLARSLIFKNLVFAKAGGGSPRREVFRQLKQYRGTLGFGRYVGMSLLNLLPRSAYGAVLRCRAVMVRRQQCIQ